VKVPLTLTFGSPADAQRADDGLKKAAIDPKFSLAVRQLFGAVKGTAQDKDLIVDIVPIFSLDPKVVREAAQALQGFIKKPN
jgi:hypothetical protein